MEQFLKVIRALWKSSLDTTQQLSADNSDLSATRAKDDQKSQSNESSLTQALFGSITALGDYHFPRELIGGCCPRVAGSEQDIAWNAAAEAADSERIHIVWQAMDDKIWYLAVRSDELASYPNTWCPFASLLPGMKTAGGLPALYCFYSDEVAVMMTVTADSLLIHRGTSSVIRAKAERLSRELGSITIQDLIPDQIAKLTPVPWLSLSLMEERARRVLATLSVLGALSVVAVGLVIWFSATLAMLSARANIEDTRARTEDKAQQLMRQAQSLRASPMREQLRRFVDVNDGLLAMNGYLEFYQIKEGRTLWRAAVPTNVTSNRIGDIGAMTLDSRDGMVIVGNQKEALSFKRQ
jgi:hypothetical protein